MPRQNTPVPVVSPLRLQPGQGMEGGPGTGPGGGHAGGGTTVDGEAVDPILGALRHTADIGILRCNKRG